MSGTDFSPLVQLLLVGLAVGSVPLALWGWRGRTLDRRQRLRRLGVLILFLTFDLVVFGAFTRLSDSGLGCPDWPGCYGKASPLGAAGAIAAEMVERPQGPVTHGKAWVEMVHRYWASAVGLLLIVQAALAWAWRRETGRGLALLAGVTLLWVLIQGLFGAWTVTWKLFPAIVTAHLLGGLVLLALQGGMVAGLESARWSLSVPSRRWLGAGLVLCVVQLSLGGWVSTNYAVMACPDFPSCAGVWQVPAEAAPGFEVWRELGSTAHGRPLPIGALQAIHMAHRLGAVLFSAVLLGLIASLWREHPRWARGLLALLALQWVSGVSNVVLGWPLVAALGHSAGAAAVWMMMVMLQMRARQGSR